jgi:fumarate reductase subunit D/succinate dehydrogenase hydrophobic anchor subunit
MEKIRKSYKLSFDPAAVKLVGAFVGSLIIYIMAFTVPANLLKLYNRTGLDGGLLFYAGWPAYLRIILAFAGLGFLYIWGLQAARQAPSKVAWFIVIGGALAFIGVLLYMAPFDAADIYDNILHGRILGVYAASPYRQVIADYPNDPFFSYAAWHQAHSAYGPLWEMLAGLTARLAGDGIVANVLAFKLLPGAFHLASVGLVILFLKNTAPEHSLSGALLLAWNPVVLYETWGNGHNDMAMTFWFLVAAWWISRRHYALAVLSLLMGALIKFIPLLLIPTVVVIGWSNLRKTSTRLIFVARTMIGICLLTALMYFPFWNGFASLDVSRRMQLFTTSLPSAINKALSPILGAQDAARAISLTALSLLFLFILHQSLQSGKHEPADAYLRAAFNILAFYLMVVCLWFHQWYGLWLITLAPLVSEGSRRLALLFGFWVLSQQLIFGPWLVPKILLAPPSQAFWLEALLALGVLGGPWAYTLRNLWAQRRSIQGADHAG